MRDVIAMSAQELDRVGVVMAVVEKRMRQREAAERLGVTQRQVKRLAARYRVAGVAGLASRRRGQRPNNAIAEAKRGAILELVQQRYADFPPTLAHEKLTEGHGYRLSVETLRGWLIEAGLWQPQARRRARLHPPRERRPCVGELVQIDGSPHDWFEGRAARCCLLAFVDDATSRLLALRFWEAETTQAYMQTLREYLQQHGRPVALYSDKHSIFRVNRPDREGEWTQFTRALKELDIEPIHAHTPQAKGRVERAFQTLQTRLPRELRLRGLDGIGAANAFLPHYRADYNARFGQAPRSEQDAHREVGRQAIELDRILCPQQVRRLSKNLTFKFQGSTYGIQGQGKGYRLRHAAVTLCAGYDGKLTVLYQGRELEAKRLLEGPPPVALDDAKSVHRTVERAKREQARRAWTAGRNHPWRKMARQAVVLAEAKRQAVSGAASPA